MTCIARTFPELIKALHCQGFSLPVFRRSPFKCNGRWTCTVEDSK